MWEVEPVRSRRIGVFLAVEGVLYAAFLTIDVIGQGSSNAVKYAGILLCIIMAALSLRRGGDPLVLIALCLTATADWFLLVRSDHYALGVSIFLCVQLVYLYRLYRNGAGIAVPWRLGVPVLAALGLAVIRMASPVNLLAGVYYAQLLVNTGLAWRQQGRRYRCFAIGLTLFVCCDTCVGLFNAGLPDGLLYRAVSVGMWFFYLPSQVLITLSGCPEEGSK